MQQILFFVVSLLASVAGAICGIGGGVIIKPVLDMAHLADVSTISFLSGCTVLSMSCYSVGKSMLAKDSSVDLKSGTYLAVGAAIGGVCGQQLFALVRSLDAHIIVLGFCNCMMDPPGDRAGHRMSGGTPNGIARGCHFHRRIFKPQVFFHACFAGAAMSAGFFFALCRLTGRLFLSICGFGFFLLAKPQLFLAVGRLVALMLQFAFGGEPGFGSICFVRGTFCFSCRMGNRGCLQLLLRKLQAGRFIQHGQPPVPRLRTASMS